MILETLGISDCQSTAGNYEYPRTTLTSRTAAWAAQGRAGAKDGRDRRAGRTDGTGAWEGQAARASGRMDGMAGNEGQAELPCTKDTQDGRAGWRLKNLSSSAHEPPHLPFLRHLQAQCLKMGDGFGPTTRCSAMQQLDKNYSNRNEKRYWMIMRHHCRTGLKYVL